MTRFDFADRPLWTMVGDAYLSLLEPLRIESAAPVADRPQYVKTLRQVGARPTRGDLDAQGYVLTQAMPALIVHIVESRVEGRTTQSLDWQLDVDVHCFCGSLDQGSHIRENDTDGIRSLTQHVAEYLHQRQLPTPGDIHPETTIDGEGIELQATEHITTNERVDWWVVRTTVMVRQWIRRQRTPQADGAELHQFGKPRREPPLATTTIEFDDAQTSAQTTTEE